MNTISNPILKLLKLQIELIDLNSREDLRSSEGYMGSRTYV